MAHFRESDREDQRKFDFLFRIVEDNMGFVPSSMKTMSRVPAILSSFSMLTGTLLGEKDKVSLPTILKLTAKNAVWSSKFIKDENRIPLYLKHLVAHIASHAGGCKYCQAHTISQAKNSGTAERQLYEIWNFEESSEFDEAEKVALRFALAAGSFPNAVTNEHFQDLSKHYSEEQIVELGAIVSLFGFLNRWNDTFATRLEEEAIEVANEYLKPQGWTIGKHQ